MATRSRSIPVAALLAVAASLGGCATSAGLGGGRQLSERECMARVMYFESNRSSDDGMLAVGSVVMNRLQSPRYPKTVCAVVDQHNQLQAARAVRARTAGLRDATTASRSITMK